ncbi:hypothetical protein [Nostoc linckia]|uniref:hypothetical protein n=1 Tax=Nostoc linckia TaxID=92942 RepID=UPI00117EE091|nr:hypothetical protein [Nostoc linckia]
MSNNSIKCLSLCQPNAWLIFHGSNIQSQNYSTNHKGLILIHAGKFANKRQLKQIQKTNPLTPAELPTQAIIGSAELVSCSWSDEARNGGEAYAYHWYFHQAFLWDKYIPFVAKDILFNIPFEMIKSYDINLL